MYKSGKQWVAVAVATTAAGIAISSHDSASADVWQANTVTEVANQLAQAGGLSTYDVHYGDTVWALAMANGESVASFENTYGVSDALIADVAFANQATNMAGVAQTVAYQPQQVAVSSEAVAATQPAAVDTTTTAAEQASEAAAQSSAAASEAMAQSEAASVAASQAAAASYAASVAQSEAQAASMAAAESAATQASEAAASSAAQAAVAAASSAAQAQVNADKAASDQQAAAQAASSAAAASQAAASEAAARQVAAAPHTQPAASLVSAGSADMATFNALNSLRQSHGLAPLTLDAGLTARAQARAQQMANLGGVASDHYSTAGEVVAIDFASGSTVVNAWFNETNMMPYGTTGHRDWEMNAGYTRVGIAIVNGYIVGEAN